MESLTTDKLIELIENIRIASNECIFRIPSDMFCHSSKDVNAEQALHEIKDFNQLYSNHKDITTTWEIWNKDYSKLGIIERVYITAHNKMVDSFNPGNLGPLD